MFDVNKIRQDFPMIVNHPELIYFDSGATSFKPQCVIDAVTEYYQKDTSNIHRGDYDISFNTSAAYDDVRNKVQSLINASSEKEIVFTSGSTASLNMIAYGLQDLIDKDDVILCSNLEHASSILPMYRLAAEKNARIIYIPLDKNGNIDLDEYENIFKSNHVKIVSLTYVSNVMGTIMPLKKMIEIAHRSNAIVSVDGAQAVPHMSVDVKDLDIDLLSFSAHKMCGPSGVGVLYGKMSILEQMKPMMLGGGANARFKADGTLILKNVPERFEAGTPAIEAVLGFGAAIDYLKDIGIDKIEDYEKELGAYLLKKLSELDNVEIVSTDSKIALVSFNVKNVFAQDASTFLNSKNIACRTGNHCAKILSDITCVNESIRASLYFYNTFDEIDQFVDIVKEITLEKCIGVLF